MKRTILIALVGFVLGIIFTFTTDFGRRYDFILRDDTAEVLIGDTWTGTLWLWDKDKQKWRKIPK